MKNILKKLSLPAYLFPISALLALVGLIVAVVSCSGEGFGMKEMPLLVILTIGVLLMAAGIIASVAKCGDHPVVSAAAFLMVLMLAGCVCAMVLGKSDVFGTVIFSALERGYAPAEQASALGVVSIVFYLVSAAAACAGSFFRLGKKA